MADLWALEAQIKGQPPQERLHARRELATPIVDELFTRWEDELTRISGKSKLAEAIRYGLSRKSEFKRFLDDGRIDIDNNSVERAIRPQTITRKMHSLPGQRLVARRGQQLPRYLQQHD